MVAKLSSAKTMSEADLATSVPVTPMAIPMCACFSAGASLTPSPVMATISSIAIRHFTSSRLCAGSTRANTRPPSPRRASVRSCSLIASNWSPVNTRCSAESPLTRMPTSRAMALAVSLESPVIMITLMPAVLHCAMHLSMPSRTGSLMHTTPRKVAPCSNSLYLLGSASRLPLFASVSPAREPASGTSASARHLSPWAWSLATCAMSWKRSWASIGLVPFSPMIEVHFWMTRSGAPLSNRSFSFLWPLTIEDIAFRSEVKSSCAMVFTRFAAASLKLNALETSLG
mmetsp:Transcript_3602/g.6126  ORF Transcript_3602/g.6126 Transcript_3602/m.6126 type:complete len:286 (+) Transcript_3602:883-1740(+)